MKNNSYWKNGYSNSLAHYGIGGMRWGIRRYQNANGSYTEEGKIRYGRQADSDIPKHISKQAAKDAAEYAKAKAYYGEGSGNRRKKLKNQLSEKMKDPIYKSEFDRYLSNYNMNLAQKQADRERHTEDFKKGTKKVIKTAKNLVAVVGPSLLATISISNPQLVENIMNTATSWGNAALKEITKMLR